MLLNTIVKTVKRKSHRGDQAVTTDQITTDIVACVNEAMRDIEKFLPLQFFHKKATVAVSSGVAGTPAVYSLASDVQEPISFWYSLNNGYYKLHKIDSDKEWLSGIWDPSASTNQPLYYREIGPDASGYKQIEIFPISNASITLNYEYYRTKTSDLSTSDLSSNLPDLPDYVQDVVEKGALYYFLLGFDDPSAEQKKRDYNEALMRLANADDRNDDGNSAFRWPRHPYRTPGFRLDR